MGQGGILCCVSSELRYLGLRVNEDSGQADCHYYTRSEIHDIFLGVSADCLDCWNALEL